jgi:SAM-dependent methyltransferase
VAFIGDRTRTDATEHRLGRIAFHHNIAQAIGMNPLRAIRWYAELARDIIFKPKYRPSDFWEKRHAEEHTFWTVGRRAFSEKDNAEWYGQLAKDLVAEFQADGLDLRNLSVLEIGTGIGYWTRLLRKQGCTRYIGVEIAQSAVDWLRTQFPDCEFALHDASQSLPSGPFNLVVMMHVDEHIHGENFLSAQRNIKAAMAPDARFFTITGLSPRQALPCRVPHP